MTKSGSILKIVLNFLCVEISLKGIFLGAERNWLFKELILFWLLIFCQTVQIDSKIDQSEINERNTAHQGKCEVESHREFDSKKELKQEDLGKLLQG